MKKLTAALLERELGLRGSLHWFVAHAFEQVEPGEKFVDNWHIEDLCGHLEAAFRGEIRQLAICIPPGHMKSLIVSVLFPVWAWIRNPSLRFAVIGYDAELTGTRDGGKVGSLVRSDWFKERWGDRVMIPTDYAKSHILTQAGGFRFATSIRGKYTGRHVHFEIVDDPSKPQDLTKNALEEVQTWRTRVAPTRLLPTEPGTPGARIYIMQRLHEDDAIGHAEREERATPGEWVFVRYPMRFEPDDKCVTKWGGDRRTDEGELLWPSRFREEEVARRERIMGPKNTAAQFQQRPTPDGGLIFSRDDFRFYQCAPSKFDEIILSVDATFKDATTSDFVCIGVWGRKAAEFFLLDCEWARMSFAGTIEAIRKLNRRWPRARAKLIEDKANGSAIISTLQKEIPGIIAVNPEGGKEARAAAVQPFFAAHNVFFPDPKNGCITQPEKGGEPVTYEWVDRLTTELESFPLGRNDDGVDMTSQALLYFRQRQNRFSEAMAKLRAQGGRL